MQSNLEKETRLPAISELLRPYPLELRSGWLLRNSSGGGSRLLQFKAMIFIGKTCGADSAYAAHEDLLVFAGCGMSAECLKF